MAFKVEDFHDLIALLEQQPGWREELRRVLLTDELLALPKLVRELVETAQRSETRLERLEAAVQSLAESQLDVKTDIGALKGSDLERRHQERAPAYLRGIVRRCHALSPDERMSMLDDAVDRAELTEEEADSVMLADVIARGVMREDRRRVYLVVEVSWGVGVHDVERAIDRARILSKLGVEALPVVAGEWITPDARDYISAARIWQVQSGRATPPAAA